MEIDKKKRFTVIEGGLPGLKKLLDEQLEEEGTGQKTSTPPPPPPAAVTKEIVSKTPSVDAPKSRYGGLHQLAVADFDPVPSAEPDFSKYRLGFNNRNLLSPIVDDLNRRFGVKLGYGFTPDRLEAYADFSTGLGVNSGHRTGFKIGERVIDELVEGYGPLDTRAIATFAVAHEFFHALLRHAELNNPAFRMPNGWRVKQYEKYRKLIEFQVDYLAARYLRVLGLPLEPVCEVFRNEMFKESKDYPSGAERESNVLSARNDEFRLDLFSNEVLDCLDFLESLVIKP